MPITKVCRDNNCFYFSLKNDIYIFDPPLLNGYYDIYSNNLKVTYNLNNQDNYINDSTNGLLYFIEYQNEIISKPPDKEEKPDYTVDDSQVSINIPDTGISQILLDEHIIVIKKKEFEY